MTDISFRLGKGVLVLGGDITSSLVCAGMPTDACPEELNILDAEMVADAHRSYLLAGANCLLSNTSGASAYALAAFGLSADADAINRAGVRIARSVHPEHVIAALGPCGLTMGPQDDTTFDDVYRQYFDQVRSLAAENPEAILIGSMTDVADARCALIAAREACDLPVIVGCVFGTDGRMSVSGTDPAAAAIALEAAGASAVGMDRCMDVESVEGHLLRMAEVTALPVMVRMDITSEDGGGRGPQMALRGLSISGGVSRRDTASLPSAWAQRFRDAGAALIGTTAGSRPVVTGAIAAMVGGDAVRPMARASDKGGMLLAGPRGYVRLGNGASCRTIGERINPSGKATLTASLQNGDLSSACAIGREQVSAGVDLLDVNVGAPGVDVAQVFPRLVDMLTECCDVPLVFDCTDPVALERSLRRYPGRALINSVTGDHKVLGDILPLAVRYGAAVVVLAMEDGVVPTDAQGRVAVIDRVRDVARHAGMSDDDLLYDVLALAQRDDASANDVAYETLRIIHDRGLLTLMGVSNVSFGLANRMPYDVACTVNALEEGADVIIVNPCELEVMAAVGHARDSIARA
jgi:5-methyltetrahydrofolate--homocysteine methyltransferase